MRKTPETLYKPISIESLKSIEAKRTAFILLLEQMVDSHRIKNPHDLNSAERVNKKIRPDQSSQSVWIDHSVKSVEDAINWYIHISGRGWARDDDMVEMFHELLIMYIIPLDNMISKLDPGSKFSKSEYFETGANQVLQIARNRRVCSQHPDWCKQFSDSINKILSRME